MKNYLALIALLACSSLTAQSQPGKPVTTGATVPPPCLTVTQRVRLGDSLAMLPRVRKAAMEWRTSSDLAQRKTMQYGNALVAQQRLTTEAAADSDNWKRKARKRGLLNWLFITAAAGLTYLSVR